MQAFADSELAHDLARDVEFERIYRRYARDVYRYTLALLRNPADAEDITQTTFLNAYRAYLRGEEPLKPRHWLIKIAHNACRSRHLRAARRPQEVPLEETIAAVRVPPHEAPKVDELLAALARLPFNQRAALVMRELEGRSYAEISETLEVSVSAVETLIFRARRTVRRDRSLLGALSAVQLPPSLANYVVGGSGAVAGGGAAAGTGVLFKVVMAVTASVVAGTVGTGVEKVMAKNARPPTPAALGPEGSAVTAGSAAGSPRGTGLRGPIVVTRNADSLVVTGGAFGADPAARLAGGPDVEGGAVSGADGRPSADPVGDGEPMETTSAAASAPPATSSDKPSSTTPSSSNPLPATTEPLTDTVSDASAPVTSAVPASVPSPPAAPPLPVAVPAVPEVPTPTLPDPPHLP